MKERNLFLLKADFIVLVLSIILRKMMFTQEM